MPTINVNKVDLERLCNISLSDKMIEDRFPMMGVEVEEIFEEVDKGGKKQKMVQFSINPDRPDYLSRITSYNVGYTKLLRSFRKDGCRRRAPPRR